MFVLLGCLTTSTVFDPKQYLCDSGSSSNIYSFGSDEGDPMKWEFGISLLYNNSYYVYESCKNCEDSGGSCGFSGADESFACICRNGVLE
ncbi:hypothetical protein MTR67_030728, partial [Solanum verrucosum]